MSNPYDNQNNGQYGYQQQGYPQNGQYGYQQQGYPQNGQYGYQQGVYQQTPPLHGGLMTLLVILTLFVPLVGVIAGFVNMKHESRKGQSVALVVVGFAMMAINFMLIAASGGF
ncbi:MAG: hypothetical protein IJZ10_05775 [Thermoguttaceae bacterium]|nr:hypothetical protein [Thermoguttaceae bacterium]